MQAQVEDCQSKALGRSEKPSGQALLEAALAYVEATPGSGFRGHLVDAASYAVGLAEPQKACLQRGIEAFHIASLILDDLPCMDDATQRRGRACLHIAYSEQTAMLAALELINRGYTCCWEVGLAGKAGAKLMKFVRRRMGVEGILGGQARDLSFNSHGGAAEVRAIALQKTGALLELALVLPALAGGAAHSVILDLCRLGRAWGLIYQGIDDFKDFRLTQQDAQKTPFRDLELQRPNLVLALGRAQAALEVTSRLGYAERILERLGKVGHRWTALSRFQQQLNGMAAEIHAMVEAA